MKIKLNKELRGLPVGSVVNVVTDKYGVIKDKYWRARMNDSKIDKCIQAVTEKKGK